MTPALERLLNIASQARSFIAHEHGPVPLVYELGEAIAELNKSPAEQHQERLEEVLQWNR